MAKMKKYASMADEKINEILASWDDEKLKQQEGCFSRDLAKLDFPFKKKKADGTTIWVTKDYMTKILNAIKGEIAKRNGKTAQETDVPAAVVEIPIPTMAKETAPDTSNAGETNVNKKLPKKSPKTVAKAKKNNYINTTNETKTTKTTKTGDKTMINKNEIAKIAPNAVKNILAAQKTNKTDTKKTYWGGWAKVHAGMNAAYNDYEKYQNLETEWLELRQKLGGTKSPLYHFCWKLINSNRVGVKQEPNATLRFIKNAKIRIAMANDVLANKKKYKNEIAENWKATFGTEI
ncbi:MAG: hypothetical protein II220_01285 [Spirochaetales bacterium]|nr:hypothetical protein [Spirochaetales bacterium]